MNDCDKDYTSHDGAQSLRDSLISHWFLHTQGAVEVKIVLPYEARILGGGAVRDVPSRYDLRSDLIDGMPRGYAGYRLEQGRWVLIRGVADEKDQQPSTETLVGVADAGGETGVHRAPRSGEAGEPVQRDQTGDVSQRRAKKAGTLRLAF